MEFTAAYLSFHSVEKKKKKKKKRKLAVTMNIYSKVHLLEAGDLVPKYLFLHLSHTPNFCLISPKKKTAAKLRIKMVL